jgi:hypothetical protein
MKLAVSQLTESSRFKHDTFAFWVCGFLVLISFAKVSSVYLRPRSCQTTLLDGEATVKCIAVAEASRLPRLVQGLG